MPTFDFQCEKCNTIFEFNRPFGSKKNPICPKCKSKKVEKIFSPPSIQFKGSGFYKTDSAPKHKEEKDTPKPATPPPTPTPAPKTESK